MTRTAPPVVTHHVMYDEPGRFTARTLCGLYIRRRESVVEPTCEMCRRQLELLDAADPTPTNER